MDYPRFQYSEFSPDGSKGQIVVRGDDPVQWAEDIKIALKVFTKVEPTKMEKAMEEFIDEPKVDMSHAPLCPVHKKPMRQGKYPGTWFCATPIGEDEKGNKIWCKEKPHKSMKWE